MKDFFSKKWVRWTIGLSSFALVLVILFVSLGSTSTYSWGEAATLVFDVILVDNFIGVTSVFLGLITFIGYLVLGRGTTESLLGFIRTVIGYITLTLGSGILVGMLKPLFSDDAGIASVFDGFSIVPLDPYTGWSSGNDFLEGFEIGAAAVSWVAYAFIIGFAFNIALVALNKWTNITSINVTGHTMLQQSTLVVVVFAVLLFGGSLTSFTVANQVGLVIISGLFLGSYWGFGSTLTYKPTQVVTNDAGFAIGHQQMFGAAIAYKIGGFFGDSTHSSESRTMPKKLKIFEDNIFTQIIILFLVVLTLVLIINIHSLSSESYLAFNPGVGYETIPGDPSSTVDWFSTWNVSGGAHWVVNMVLGAFQLSASILVIVTGVRMFVTELQQSFQGISEKLVPSATVGVDIAAIYGFAPNSATFGFISGTVGQFLAVAIAIGISAIPSVSSMSIGIPLFITLFFNSGAVAIYANASGGWKATLAVPFIFGFIEIALVTTMLSVFNNLEAAQVDGVAAFSSGYNGMFDWTAVFSVPTLVSSSSKAVAWIVYPLCIVAMLVGAQIIDSGKQTQKTALQKFFKLNPKLVSKTAAKKAVV